MSQHVCWSSSSSKMNIRMNAVMSSRHPPWRTVVDSHNMTRLRAASHSACEDGQFHSRLRLHSPFMQQVTGRQPEVLHGQTQPSLSLRSNNSTLSATHCGLGLLSQLASYPRKCTAVTVVFGQHSSALAPFDRNQLNVWIFPPKLLNHRPRIIACSNGAIGVSPWCPSQAKSLAATSRNPAS